LDFVCLMLVVNRTYLLSGDMVTNGGIERFHGTMHAMLAKWIQANQRTGTRNSQRLLSHIVLSQQSAVSSSVVDQ